MKLASKIILLFVVAVIAVTSLSSHFTSKQFLAEAKRQHQSAAQMLAAHVNDAEFQEAMRSQNFVYLREMLRNANGQSFSVRIVQFYSDDPQAQPLADRVPQLMQGDKPWASTTADGAAGDRHLVTYYQLPNQGSTAIELASPLEVVDAQTKQTWLCALLAIGAIGLLSVAIIAIAGVRMIAYPLDRLTEKMKRVGEGDFRSDLEVTSRDELGELAQSVNEMCDRLREQKAALESASEQKIAALEQLRHADRLKTVGQLAAGFAHEIGSPLNVIAGRASMLMQNSSDSEMLQRNAQAIHSEARRIAEIVEGLLNFSRQAEGKRAVADLRESLRHAVDLMDTLAAKKGVRLELELPDSPALAEIDTNQMQQIVTNLIDNAVDAAPESSVVTLSLHSGLGDREGQWLIRVTDQGPGMTAEVIDKLFEPFFTTKEVGQGTGLGLSIVHGIVEEHNGEVLVESTGNEGTCMLVALPKAAVT